MKKFLILTILLLAFLPGGLQAANVFPEVSEEVKSGETFSVVVYADTEGVAINSARITLAFDETRVKFSGYGDEGLIRLWTKLPEEDNGTVVFEGIIPGGIAGVYDPRGSGLAPAPLAELLFTAGVPGTGSFRILESVILKNDGQGTALPHNRESRAFLVRVEDKSEDYEDNAPPAPFAIEIISSPPLARTPALLQFQTTDAESGVRSYEIKVGRADWRRAQSPVAVPRHLFSVQVIVRAYDFYGNFQEASVIVPGILTYKLLLTILILLLSGILIYKVIKSKR